MVSLGGPEILLILAVLLIPALLALGIIIFMVLLAKKKQPAGGVSEGTNQAPSVQNENESTN
jgi:flagellar basal body-associated protein FliL